MKNFYVCIMAGGAGERFWPLSRRDKPKHLLHLLSEETFLEQTFHRVRKFVAQENIFILTNHSQQSAIQKLLPHVEIFAEPDKRDTAPAAALATAIAAKKNPDAVLALLPADALIHDHEHFQKQLADAAELALKENSLVTIAIKPTYPATGFGYLEMEKSLGEGTQGSRRFSVERFVEKPDVSTAEKYLNSGKYFWNAGIFVWKVSEFRNEAKRLQPELEKFISHFIEARDEEKFLKETFSALPKISVDYAIMEKAGKVSAVQAEFDWDDVGSWTSLPAHLGKDVEGNSCKGKVVLLDSKENIAISRGRTIALCGVKDLVVVETADAVLVCHKDAAQNIKKLQSLLPPEIC